MDKYRELSGYLEDSFGNSQRVDYGTGHETTFFVFFYCLYKGGILQREDLPAALLLVFPAYLKVCRHLQTIYWLEPAGSHGVWCLDDYQLLPFVFGAAQLIDNEEIPPSVSVFFLASSASFVPALAQENVPVFIHFVPSGLTLVSPI